MSTVTLGDLRKGDCLKSYDLFNDEKWHFVYDVGPGKDSSHIYLALEGYRGQQFRTDIEVEKK